MARLVFIFFLLFSIRFYFHEIHHFLVGKLDFSHFSFYLQFFFILMFYFLDLVLFLIFLAYSSKIQNFRVNKYSNIIMKELHYNRGTSTLIAAAGTVIAGVSMMALVEVAEIYRCRTQVKGWEHVSGACIKAGIQPPDFLRCSKSQVSLNPKK